MRDRQASTIAGQRACAGRGGHLPSSCLLPPAGTIGYGDIVAVNNTEKIYCMVAVVFGISLFAYGLHGTIALLQQLSSGEGGRLKRCGTARGLSEEGHRGSSRERLKSHAPIVVEPL